MKLKRIKETCLYVTDLYRTKAFYTEILKLETLSLVEGRHVFFRAGESVLLCFVADVTEKEEELPPHGAWGNIHFAFETDANSYRQYRNHLLTQNIPILHEHNWPNGIRSFYFHDPDNHVVEIIEEGLWD